MDVNIHIPDNTFSWKMKYSDQLYFWFDSDITGFYVDTPDAFNPSIPRGDFPKDNKIGPYKPRKRDTDVSFYYDGETTKPMHTVHIGD
jgi:hypothetical protein